DSSAAMLSDRPDRLPQATATLTTIPSATSIFPALILLSTAGTMLISSSSCDWRRAHRKSPAGAGLLIVSMPLRSGIVGGRLFLGLKALDLLEQVRHHLGVRVIFVAPMAKGLDTMANGVVA